MMIRACLAAVPVFASLLGGCASTPVTTTSAAKTARPHPGTENMPEVRNPMLRGQLMELHERDQQARAAVVEAMRNAERVGGAIRFDEKGTAAMHAMTAIDAESSAFLKDMIDEHGWPTYDMVGEDGAKAAWLLAQHADAQPELQQRVLGLMEPLIKQEQASGALYAMLTDRVLTGKGEKQVYGTQFGDDNDGVLRPLPTIEWDTVDDRRAAVGLAPIAEYAASLGETYGQHADTTPMETDPSGAAHAPEPDAGG